MKYRVRNPELQKLFKDLEFYGYGILKQPNPAQIRALRQLEEKAKKLLGFNILEVTYDKRKKEVLILSNGKIKCFGQVVEIGHNL